MKHWSLSTSIGGGAMQIQQQLRAVASATLSLDMEMALGTWNVSSLEELFGPKSLISEVAIQKWPNWVLLWNFKGNMDNNSDSWEQPPQSKHK